MPLPDAASVQDEHSCRLQPARQMQYATKSAAGVSAAPAGPAGRRQAELGAKLHEVLLQGGRDFHAESARCWRVLTTCERAQVGVPPCLPLQAPSSSHTRPLLIP